MDMDDVKTFSIAEANSLLPVLRKLTGTLEIHHAEILSLQAQIDALELIIDKDRKENSPNDEELATLTKKLNNCGVNFKEIVENIQSYGCHLKGISPTLIDFFHAHDGHIVYLCWKSDEDAVAHWHEVSKGFNDRQPVTELGSSDHLL